MNIERSVGDRTSTSSPGAAVMVASSQSDADAVAAVVRHHAELAGTLALLADSLLTTAADETGDGAGSVTPARARLADFCLSDLLPHAAAEEATLYPAAASGERARLLVEAMVAEHRVLEGLVDEVRTTESPVRAAAAANALRVLFDMHLAKENDLILPLLAADPSVSLAALPAGMHELLGASDQHAREDVAAGNAGRGPAVATDVADRTDCGCGGSRANR